MNVSWEATEGLEGMSRADSVYLHNHVQNHAVQSPRFLEPKNESNGERAHHSGDA